MRPKTPISDDDFFLPSIPLSKSKSLTNQYPRLLTEEDLNRIKDKF